jgi:hypothetical protein
MNDEDMAISDGSGKNRLIYKQVFSGWVTTGK